MIIPKNKLYKLITKFITTTSLKLGLVNLIVVEIVSMKKIRHFLKTVMFWIVQKTFIEYQKKSKNHI